MQLASCTHQASKHRTFNNRQHTCVRAMLQPSGLSHSFLLHIISDPTDIDPTDIGCPACAISTRRLAELHTSTDTGMCSMAHVQTVRPAAAVFMPRRRRASMTVGWQSVVTPMTERPNATWPIVNPHWADTSAPLSEPCIRCVIVRSSYSIGAQKFRGPVPACDS